jgi:glycosyltransferase involved in cell wall biosynthesis
MPAISVLMPAYNAATYIAQAIDSILQQTFRDFELIIVNDGSTDRTEDIVLSYQDNRIRYFKNDGNKGLIYTRNKLVELSSANFIAFLDSDDLSMNTRLERQYAKFAADERLSFVSTSFYMINEYGEIVNRDNFYDLNSEELKSTFLFLNPVATSSIMIRKAHLPGEVFRVDYPVCEDYDLWTRMMITHKGIVLPDFLVSYRVYNDSICKQQPKNIIDRRNKIVLNQLEYYFPNMYSAEDAAIHLSLVEFSLKNSLQDIPALEQWIYKILDLNSCYHHFEERILSQVLYERILKKFLRLQQYNISVFRTLLRFRKRLQPILSAELRKKEAAILAFSLTRKRWINL